MSIVRVLMGFRGVPIRPSIRVARLRWVGQGIKPWIRADIFVGSADAPGEGLRAEDNAMSIDADRCRGY